MLMLLYPGFLHWTQTMTMIIMTVTVTVTVTMTLAMIVTAFPTRPQRP